MTHWLNHSLVLAADYRVPDPATVSPLLERSQTGLVELGAHHALVYASTTEPTRVFVVLALHTPEPVLDVMRSHVFLDWFEAAGVEDIPAVFAGELIERVELVKESGPVVPEVMVSLVAPVEDLQRLIREIRDSADSLRASGVRKLLMFSAFDNPLEVMLVVEIDDESDARLWLDESHLAGEWLDRTGIGAYPPVFVGTLQRIIQVEQTGRARGG